MDRTDKRVPSIEVVEGPKPAWIDCPIPCVCVQVLSVDPSLIDESSTIDRVITIYGRYFGSEV